MNRKIISLEHWIDLCVKENIPHVPIEFVAAISWEDFGRAVDCEKPTESGQKFFDAFNKSYEPNYMTRWDCCASMWIKGELGTGNPEWHRKLYNADCCDMRVPDIVYANYHDRQDVPIKLWKRPWIKAKIEARYPVEFRVFASESAVKAVCNYYPQRDLPEEYRGEAVKAFELSKRFLKHEPEFTADWILREDGQLLFLEGGPPWGKGADPCCFRPDEPVDGVLLENKFDRG